MSITVNGDVRVSGLTSKADPSQRSSTLNPPPLTIISYIDRNTGQNQSSERTGLTPTVTPACIIWC
jgi:hypothetical protein